MSTTKSTRHVIDLPEHWRISMMTRLDVDEGYYLAIGSDGTEEHGKPLPYAYAYYYAADSTEPEYVLAFTLGAFLADAIAACQRHNASRINARNAAAIGHVNVDADGLEVSP